MKTNKIRILAALALGGFVACGAIAQAEDTNKSAKPPGEHQAPPGPRGDMKERGARMAEELGLSDDQKTKVQEVMKEQMEKGRALREDTALSDEDRSAKRKALREETETKMKGVLTAEQFEKWQKVQARRGPGGRGGDGKPPGDKPADNPDKN